MSHRKDEAERILGALMVSYRTGPYANEQLVAMALDAMESSGVFKSAPPKPVKEEPVEAPSAVALDGYLARFIISMGDDGDGESGVSLWCNDCEEEVDSVDECSLARILVIARDHNQGYHS